MSIAIVFVAVLSQAAELFTINDSYQLSYFEYNYAYSLGTSPSAQLSTNFTGASSPLTATFGANDTPALSGLTAELMNNSPVHSHVTVNGLSRFSDNPLSYPDTTDMAISGYVVDTRLGGWNANHTYWAMQVHVLGSITPPQNPSVPEPSSAILLLGFAAVPFRRIRPLA
jgi:hypothetical protein